MLKTPDLENRRRKFKPPSRCEGCLYLRETKGTLRVYLWNQQRTPEPDPNKSSVNSLNPTAYDEVSTRISEITEIHNYVHAGETVTTKL